MPDDTKDAVTCVRCHNRFDAFAPTQAHDCACDLRGKYVIGAYGSTALDMESVILLHEEDHGFPNGQICDACITEMRAHGDLQKGFSHV